MFTNFKFWSLYGFMMFLACIKVTLDLMSRGLDLVLTRLEKVLQSCGR